MAPEVHKSPYFDIARADLFSIGVILFVMAYGSPPFTTAMSKDDHFDLMCQDRDEYCEFMRELNPNVSREFEDLIFKMLSKDPKKRLSVTQIKSHPWYHGKTSSYQEAVKELNAGLMREYRTRKSM